MNHIVKTAPLTLDTAFELFMRNAFGSPKAGDSWIPAANISKNNDNIEINLEVPGIPLDNIDVEVNANTLTVSGKRETDTSSDDGHYVHKEIRSGSFSRSFRLPHGVTGDMIQASYGDGILTLHVSLPAELEPQKILVTAKEGKPSGMPLSVDNESTDAVPTLGSPESTDTVEG